MEEVLKKLKEMQEKNSNIKEGSVIDILYYGKVVVSKNDAQIENERKEDLYLVKKEVNGQIEFEFKTDIGTLAKVDKNGEIKISEQYKNLLNEKELLLQLHDIIPTSLKELENELANKKENTNSKDKTKKEEIQNNQYQENASDIEIDINKKITSTKTFAQLVPEVGKKGINKVKVRRKGVAGFEFIGINAKGEEIKLESLKQTEGTNPTKEVITVNKDGSEVKKESVYTMVRIDPGQNQGNGNEGFTVDIGDYGTPEINYYRRSGETNQYTSIPVNLKNTNQKRTEKDVQNYLEKTKNNTVANDIERADDRIEYNEDERTTLDSIDDDLSNDKTVDDSEIIIRKAAKRCKVSVESFKEELEKADGDTLEEKIENAEEEINEQFIGSRERK